MAKEKVPGHDVHYHLLNYDENGAERGGHGRPESATVLALAASEQPTDVFVFSHGWNGDLPAAREQYGKWIATMADCLEERQRARALPGGFRSLLIGLHWPSKAWGNEDVDASTFGDGPEAWRAIGTIVHSALDELAPETLPPDVRQALEQLDRLGDDDSAEGYREPFDAERLYQGGRLDDGLRQAGLFTPLRVLTFWKMKKRARTFGESGAAAFVRDVQRSAPGARIHLMGHSFGAIVASAAAAGAFRPVASLSLIQGAMSLWSFCSNIPAKPGTAGHFRPVLANRKVSGPIVVSTSVHDRAVGTFYPLAAWSGRQLDYDPDSPPKYGGIGAHGVHGPDVNAVHHGDVRQVRELAPGRVHNVDARSVVSTSDGIAGAHNDICHAELGRLVWRAVTSGR